MLWPFECLQCFFFFLAERVPTVLSIHHLDTFLFLFQDRSKGWKLYLAWIRVLFWPMAMCTLCIVFNFWSLFIKGWPMRINMSTVGEKCYAFQAKTNSCWCQCLCTLVWLWTYPQGRLWFDFRDYDNHFHASLKFFMIIFKCDVIVVMLSGLW